MDSFGAPCDALFLPMVLMANAAHWTIRWTVSCGSVCHCALASLACVKH